MSVLLHPRVTQEDRPGVKARGERLAFPRLRRPLRTALSQKRLFTRRVPSAMAGWGWLFGGVAGVLAEQLRHVVAGLRCCHPVPGLLGVWW